MQRPSLCKVKPSKKHRMMLANSICKLGVLLIFGQLAFTSAEGLEDGQVFTECGGTVVSDFGFLQFPDPGTNYVPGTVCAWTIHLSTLQDFRLSFESFNIPSLDNCSDAGIKLYSLTNLQATPEPESYTFCDTAPPGTQFFIGKSVLTVVFYSDLPQSSKAFFTLNWMGDAFDPLRTKHDANLLRSTSGAIRYPVMGNYEKNLAATWLVSPRLGEDSDMVDIMLREVTLQGCVISPDSCFCDALFIYEVGRELSLLTRYCSSDNSTDYVISASSSQILIALFTDNDESVSAEGRFGLDYYPRQGEVPSTVETTTVSTTTTTTQVPSTPDPTNSTECGVTFNAPRGRIGYKVDESYDTWERCSWIIRAEGYKSIRFQLVTAGFDSSNDAVHVVIFQHDMFEIMHQQRLGRSSIGTDYILEGTVAVVMFATDTEITGTGFILEWEGVEEGSDDIHPLSSDHIIKGSNGSLSYPAADGEYYQHYELTTFLFETPGARYDLRTVNFTIQPKTFGGIEDSCHDRIWVYYFFLYTTGFELSKRLCQEDINPIYIYPNRVYIPLVVFQSDLTVAGTGFRIEWSWSEGN